MTLDETTLRKPGFVEGVAIVLADGQAWHFRKPVVTDLYPRAKPDGSYVVASGYDRGPEYDALMDRYVDAEDGAEEFLLVCQMAYRLLVDNYDLKPDDLRYILRRVPASAEGPEADANRAMWTDLAALCVGQAPKPIPVG